MHAITGTYVFDQRRRDEHERLRSMEELWDEGTKSLIETIPVAPGWRCLEVGAGGGSIAAWLADMVGPTGAVLATDISTDHLDSLERPNLEVRRHDILTDALPDGSFDLIHARLLVEHVGGRALERMVSALRPGGWLAVEDFDWRTMCTHPHDEHVQGVMGAMAAVMSQSGYDPACGRKLDIALERAGLINVSAEGRVRFYRGGSAATAMLRLSIDSLRTALVDSGDVTPEDVDRALRRLGDPGTTFVSPAMIAARGRKALNEA